MTVQTNGKALQIAKTYVEAIANRDVEKIMSVAADGIICKSPIGQTQGAERFRQFHGGFAKMIKKREGVDVVDVCYRIVQHYHLWARIQSLVHREK